MMSQVILCNSLEKAISMTEFRIRQVVSTIHMKSYLFKIGTATIEVFLELNLIKSSLNSRKSKK